MSNDEQEKTTQEEKLPEPPQPPESRKIYENFSKEEKPQNKDGDW